MRIIGGEARGRRLYLPGTSAVRPTADRIKEAFFSIIGPVDGKTFLDLFAGTGNMGLEALSRGALKAAFVENDRALVDTIGKNIRTCGFGGKSEVLKSDFIAAIQTLANRSDTFDILFADPPYERGFVNRVLEHPESGTLMAGDGLFAVQHSIREALSNSEPGLLFLTDQRQYGDTIVSFFKKRDVRDNIGMQPDVSCRCNGSIPAVRIAIGINTSTGWFE